MWRIDWFWLEKWKARRSGRRDGRAGMPFNVPCKCAACRRDRPAEGYPPYVSQLVEQAGDYVASIMYWWEKRDKPLKHLEDDAAEKKIPEIETSESSAVGEFEISSTAFNEVRHTVGCGMGILKYALVGLFACAEIAVNYDAVRVLTPWLPDIGNLVGTPRRGLRPRRLLAGA